MEKIIHTLEIEKIAHDQLNEGQLQLVHNAIAATYRSYAPYSRFYVGAAIALDNGIIVTGSNQENAAYPSGLCAERTAAFAASAQYPKARFTAIAIAARNADGNMTPQPVTPCGACRQVLLEYETLAGHDVPVLLVGEKYILNIPSIHSLLPLSFTLNKL